jgi:sigma-B regulation protein RsbU (phosphoserine phosphatase)
LLVIDDDEGGRVAAAIGDEGSAAGAHDALATIRAGDAADRGGIEVDERPEAAEHAVRLWAPLRSGEGSIGGLLLTRPAGAGVFSAGDAKLLSALAAQAATSIENARLHTAALEQARLARELQLAHEVQSRLMPTVLPSSASWQLAAWWSAAREVAGDFYDATRQGETTIVTVGDVADKGMAAALFMALTRSVLRASAVDGRDPGDVVTRANALLCADASDGMFVTLAHAHLDPDGTVRYANAGHNPPLVARAGGALERLARTGILVGWDDAARYGVETVRLAAGDALVLYTDGVTEARDARGREYGEARLVELVREHVAARRSADAIVTALRTDLAGFVGQADAFDDATVLVAVRASGTVDTSSQVPGS